MKRLVILGSMLLISSAHAASFNCHKAATKVEKMICSDPELSKMDGDMGAAYKTILKNAGNAFLTIKHFQRQWLEQRNHCPNADCVKKQYRLQLALLGRFVATSPAGSAPPGLDCKKSNAPEVLDICRDRPDMALTTRADRSIEAWRLGQLFVAARAALPEPEKEALIKSQRKWATGRRGGFGQSEMYFDRIKELQSLLAQGNVIREIVGIDPRIEDDSTWKQMMKDCSDAGEQEVPEDDGNMSYGYYAPRQDSSITKNTVILIGGTEYVLVNVLFYPEPVIAGSPPYTSEPAPDLAYSCTAVLAESAPGEGFSADFPLYTWAGVHSFADVLKGYADGNTLQNDFAVHIHKKLQSDQVTLKDKEGASRHFRWDKHTQRYVEIP